jgi:hypothetical protein
MDMRAIGLILCLALGAMCVVNVKDNVYNVTDDNFEEFVELARS